MIDLFQSLAAWVVPILLAAIPLIGFARGVRVYEVFCEGAKEGFNTAIQVLPYLVAMFVAIRVFRASNAFDLILSVLGPPAERLGIPREALPLALLRPLSGSGALAFLADILKAHGPDSFIGWLASTVQGSTETTFYVLTVYFGSVGVRRIRHAAWVGLAADAAGFLAAAAAVRMLYPG